MAQRQRRGEAGGGRAIVFLRTLHKRCVPGIPGNRTPGTFAGFSTPEVLRLIQWSCWQAQRCLEAAGWLLTRIAASWEIARVNSFAILSLPILSFLVLSFPVQPLALGVLFLLTPRVSILGEQSLSRERQSEPSKLSHVRGGRGGLPRRPREGWAVEVADWASHWHWASSGPQLRTVRRRRT